MVSSQGDNLETRASLVTSAPGKPRLSTSEEAFASLADRAHIRRFATNRHVARIPNHSGHPLGEQVVRPDTRHARDRARDGTEGATELVCFLCDLHRSRSRACLNHDRRCGQCRHQARTGNEPMAGRRCTRCDFADQQTDICDTTEQFAVARWIRAINTTWEQTVVQQCIVHLIRNSFRYAGRQHWDAIVRSLKPVYTAPSEQAAKDRFEEFAAEWGDRYPAIVQLWRAAWVEFVPFLEYDVEIRRVICTTNAIELINARYRRAVRARGHFPNETAALKCLYLVTRSLDSTGGGWARWVMRWKPALNAFAITFAGRFERTTH